MWIISLLLVVLLTIACSMVQESADPAPAPVAQAVEESSAVEADNILLVLDRNLSRFPSLIFSMSARSAKTEWTVVYAGLWQGDDARRAYGEVVNLASGEKYIFNSRHQSTCIMKYAPDSTSWTYVEHDGWDRPFSFDAFSPPAPLAILRTNPQPRWVMDDPTDITYVLVHEPMTQEGFEGVYSVLHINKDPVLLTAHIVARDNKILSIAEYNQYGNDKGVIDAVHSSHEECLARNK